MTTFLLVDQVSQMIKKPIWQSLYTHWFAQPGVCVYAFSDHHIQIHISIFWHMLCQYINQWITTDEVSKCAKLNFTSFNNLYFS